MTGFEIALFVLGAAFVIISFFIVGDTDDNKSKTTENDKERIPDELTPELLEDMRIKLRSAAEDELDDIINDTEEKLNKQSNEKIMAVSEFSEQVIEKISTNHQEVVFLYQMLKDKEAELKETVQKLDNLRIECEKVLHDNKIPAAEAGESIEKESITVKKETVPEATGQAADMASGVQKRTAEPKKKASTVKKAVKKSSPEPKRAMGINTAEKLDAGITNRNEEIIALYKKKKSVMEISKLLGMGQGEVKLIIDLYGK